MSQYLYVMKVGSDRTKIGIALSPRARKKAHEDSEGVTVEITHLWDLEGAQRFENLIRSGNRNSEWFRDSPDVVARFIERLAKDNGVEIKAVAGEFEQRGRDKRVVVMVSDSDREEIHRWERDHMPMRSGTSATVRALVRLAIDSGLVPTEEQIDSAAWHKLKKIT